MPDPVITNNKTFGVVVWEPVFEDDIIVDATGGTYPAGTLLGRLSGTGNLTAYVSGAADGSEIPIAVLKDELVLAAATPVSCRPIVSGRLRRSELSRYNGGTPDALTQAEVDALRDYSIVALNTVGLMELDNQP